MAKTPEWFNLTMAELRHNIRGTHQRAASITLGERIAMCKEALAFAEEILSIPTVTLPNGVTVATGGPELLATGRGGAQ